MFILNSYLLLFARIICTAFGLLSISVHDLHQIYMCRTEVFNQKIGLFGVYMFYKRLLSGPEIVVFITLIVLLPSICIYPRVFICSTFMHAKYTEQ